MSPRNGSILIPLLFAATTILRADTVIQAKVGGDEIALPRKSSRDSSCEPCVNSARPGDLITISVGGGRIRRDRGALSIILREDLKKLYFICQSSKQYIELAYPVKYNKLKTPGLGSPPDSFLAFQLVAPGAMGKSQIKKWPVDTFDATVVNGLRNQFRVHLAVADVGGAREALILVFRKLLNELEYSGHGWSHLLPFAHGVPIVWEETERQPQTEFVYREEVTDILVS